MIRRWASPAVAGLAAFAFCLLAPAPAAAAARLEGFAKKAALGGMAEVELGRLAAEKGSNASVRQFGQRMVDDHSKANEELRNAAREEGITLPTQIDESTRRTKEHLSKLSGVAFDKAYMKDMVTDHEKDVAEFQKASKAAEDSPVKSFAAKVLPTLEDHLKQAREVDRGLGK